MHKITHSMPDATTMQQQPNPTPDEPRNAAKTHDELDARFAKRTTNDEFDA
jgi:hypothetical protein